MKGCSYMPPTSSSSFDVVYPQMLQAQQLANLLEKGSVAESKQWQLIDAVDGAEQSSRALRESSTLLIEFLLSVKAKCMLRREICKRSKSR